MSARELSRACDSVGGCSGLGLGSGCRALTPATAHALCVAVGVLRLGRARPRGRVVCARAPSRPRKRGVLLGPRARQRLPSAHIGDGTRSACGRGCAVPRLDAPSGASSVRELSRACDNMGRCSGFGLGSGYRALTPATPHAVRVAVGELRLGWARPERRVVCARALFRLRQHRPLLGPRARQRLPGAHTGDDTRSACGRGCAAPRLGAPWGRVVCARALSRLEAKLGAFSLSNEYTHQGAAFTCTCKDRTHPALPWSCQCPHTEPGTELARIFDRSSSAPHSRALPSGRACTECCLPSSSARFPALCPRTVLSWILIVSPCCSRAPCPCQCLHCSIHGDCKDRTPPALPPPRQCIFTEQARSLQGPFPPAFPSSVSMQVLAL